VNIFLAHVQLRIYLKQLSYRNSMSGCVRIMEAFRSLENYLCDAELYQTWLAVRLQAWMVSLQNCKKNCYLCISCILIKLFNLMVLFSQVPAGFGYSHTVPVTPYQLHRTTPYTKFKETHGVVLSCEDFKESPSTQSYSRSLIIAYLTDLFNFCI
jgi:hypothetical protein